MLLSVFSSVFILFPFRSFLCLSPSFHSCSIPTHHTHSPSPLIIPTHRTQMLESNLLKIITPYSCVELAHVATCINLPEVKVVHKLEQMILDHTLNGILDQGKGQLVIYDPGDNNTNFDIAVTIIGRCCV